jgi:hypothetical protein
VLHGAEFGHRRQLKTTLMAQRRFHYEQAFEQYLREHAIPYVAVDEAKRALAPASARSPSSLKSFDFVVYSQSGPNLLVDVKGRKHSGRSTKSLDNWVTAGDVECLAQWEKIFGTGFTGAFAFLYWCEVQPPDALFTEIFTSGDRWYALLAIRLADYRTHLKRRSPKWETVNMPAKEFAQLSRPLKDLL